MPNRVGMDQFPSSSAFVRPIATSSTRTCTSAPASAVPSITMRPGLRRPCKSGFITGGGGGGISVGSGVGSGAGSADTVSEIASAPSISAVVVMPSVPVIAVVSVTFSAASSVSVMVAVMVLVSVREVVSVIISTAISLAISASATVSVTGSEVSISAVSCVGGMGVDSGMTMTTGLEVSVALPSASKALARTK